MEITREAKALRNILIWLGNIKGELNYKLSQESNGFKAKIFLEYLEHVNKDLARVKEPIFWNTEFTSEEIQDLQLFYYKINKL